MMRCDEALRRLLAADRGDDEAARLSALITLDREAAGRMLLAMANFIHFAFDDGADGDEAARDRGLDAFVASCVRQGYVAARELRPIGITGAAPGGVEGEGTDRAI